MSQLLYLDAGQTVTFELENAVPILRERYASPQAGVIELRGFFNPKAYMETLDGVRYRMLSAKHDKRYPGQIAYPVVRLPDKTELFRLLTPTVALKEKRGPAKLRFTTVFDDQAYIFKRSTRLGRAFEIWDGMEMHRVVQRERAPKLILDSLVLIEAPALLVLLLPWFDSQFLN